ncbi:SdpI family protein [Candidatus Parcubacteria bacterium]|nr:MAG: SdpI family protein [Candidatus Parcubacteria bacterium]
MNKGKRLDILSMMAIVVMIILSFYFYKVLPDQVISHWNAQGQADDYSSKTFIVVFMPLLTIGMYLLFSFLPKIDPKRANYPQFDTAYSWLKISIIFFMMIMYFVSSAMNLDFGRNWQINKIMPALMALLFIVIGWVLPKIKSNWFAGIRTPWTLFSEEIWDKTHKLAGKTFMLAGLIFLVFAFLPGEYFIYVIVGVIVMSFIPVVYSYMLYRKIRKTPENMGK